jgi:itaconate CoA-transferase
MEATVRLPLEGIRVVAIEQAVAAPFCSARLADAGAYVIKVERPEGDFARGYDDVASGQSSYFIWLNRGKESLVIDLTSLEGKETLNALLSRADVLVQNLKPGALERLGFGSEHLRQTYPRLITCSISGYGEIGPLAERKAYDLLVQAESGLCSITGGPSEPARVGISVVDIATGATAYSAILEALLARATTGEGADIRLSMFDVMADWLTVPLLQQEGGKPPNRIGLAHPSIAPYGVFRTKDDKAILISIQSDREWVKFSAEFLHNPAAAKDDRFSTNVARVANRAATDALVAEAFADLEERKARELLTRADVAFASVNDMAALSVHPHLRRITVQTPAGAVSYPAPAPIFTGAPRAYGAVPELGAHRPLDWAKDKQSSEVAS